MAAAIVAEAEAAGTLREGGTVVEATAGSTGISLALVCAAKGYRCHLVAADDVSPQKRELITALGATLELVRPAAIADAAHPVNVARARAAALGDGSIFADQFENLANTRAHEAGTAAEIWAQRSRECHTRLDWPVGRGWRDLGGMRRGGFGWTRPRGALPAAGADARYRRCLCDGRWHRRHARRCLAHAQAAESRPQKQNTHSGLPTSAGEDTYAAVLGRIQPCALSSHPLVLTRRSDTRHSTALPP